MGHIPEDENFEEYMNASAEEWSKPTEPTPQPDAPKEQVDRWGSPISEKATISDKDSWRSEPLDPSQPYYEPQKKKSSTKWWLIIVVIVVVLCLCACLTLVGLSIAGVNIFQTQTLPF